MLMNTHDQDPSREPVTPTDTGEAKIGPESMLTPNDMEALATQLLEGFEEFFPAIGAIPVEQDPASTGFLSGINAQKLYTPGQIDRPFFDSTERTGKNDPRPKDFATWYMQCFGKTVTMRIRGDLPEPETLEHAKVPRICRVLLAKMQESRGQEEIDASIQKEIDDSILELRQVIAHNLGLPKDHKDTEQATVAHVWMLNKLSANIV